MTRTYLEMLECKTFKERFEYLKLSGSVGLSTFGGHRYLNQKFYTSPEWKRFRNRIIIRDNGCDLAMEGYDLHGGVYIHHINPITIEDIQNRSESLFDPNNVVVVSFMTHQAIHYGDYKLVNCEVIERKPNDTCLWK